METKIFANKALASQAAFNYIAEALEKGKTTFGLATGDTPTILYQLLVQSSLDFSQATAVNLDEFYGLPATVAQSYHAYMQHHLFHTLDY